MRSRSKSMVQVVFVTVGLAAGCASTPETEHWVAPTPGSAPAGSPVALHGQLSVASAQAVDANGNPVTTSQLVDQNGMPFQLKGVSSMWLNWESGPFAESKAGLEYMRDNWNISAIRAAMGADPDELVGGQINEGIRDQVETIVHHAIDLGVYVLVDWHTEQAVNEQDAAVAFFTDMAKTYGAYPNVIWETYNEPNGYRDANNNFIRFTWPQIKAYHQAVVDAVRAVDPDNLMVLGTPNWSQRVDQAAADPVLGTNLLYTLHWYSCTHGQSFRDLGDTAIAGGIALFVTEFGATFSDGGIVGATYDHTYVCEDEANLWFAWMAKNDISGAAWKLDPRSDASCILNASASLDGPWPDSALSTDTGGALYTGALSVSGTAIHGGHGQFVVNWMRQ